MDATVENRIAPQTNALLDKLLKDRRDLTLGGIKIFESGDKFLPGKIAAAMAYRTLDLAPNDPRLAQRLQDFADIADLTVGEHNDSWGIYYYISALYRLKQAGLLERAVRPPTLEKLRAQLDWRAFVRPDLTLIDLPNNYTGVAFSIARLRYLLGWEDATGSGALFARMLDHYRRYSGTYGFADETEGEGRFDRYSVLLIGEIAQRLVETGMTAPPEVKIWLRRSVDLMLPRFNLNGEGFEYGRSIGTYGETAFLEVLTAAARLGVLTPQEQRMAYAFSCRIAARYADFWIDSGTGSVDMWDHGRRTDAYRGKHRIFGENLSLARQFLYTNAIWNGLGYRGRAPDPGYPHWLDTLPASTITWFARGQNDRALVTVRDRGRVIGLPIINGADGQHMHNPYFPVPFSAGMLQGSADASYPNLVPRITLQDGRVLMPLAWFKDVKVSRHGAVTEVEWRQDALDLMGGKDAKTDDSLSIVTHYVLAPGRITRDDVLIAKRPVTIARIELEFATFSSAPIANGPATIAYRSGEVRGFATHGLGRCVAAAPTDPAYRSPTGPFASVVRCERESVPSEAPIKLGWTISYRPE
ncbi:MAG TPA: hypothetical protein VK533_04765 [Sphingomonas sp.]|uniref:hypothetical protein n=1 Tax=Sphingomonas sp. TaxID=28214 RepID=UPI002C36C96B|nr:hypothetical protein [Sphingomonas sp.]HMI18835.1 hypothetical protein [Sphingomonas sp.]